MKIFQTSILLLFLFGSGILLAQNSAVGAPEDFVDLTIDGLNPTVTTVSVGTTITWRNQTTTVYTLQSGYPYLVYLPAILHTANSTRHHKRPLFSTSFGGEILPSGHLNHRFEQPGHFPYFVSDENGNILTGKIIVEGTPATSTPTATPEPTATATPIAFTLSSSAFAPNGTIPTPYTFNAPPQCSGQNLSVPLAWQGTPTGTNSFALIMEDPDANGFTHWVQFNIPPSENGLPEVINGPDIGSKGRNDFGSDGYAGPCPPSGTHRYVFTLYALNDTLALGEGAAKTAVLAAMNNAIIDQATLIGVRSP